MSQIPAFFRFSPMLPLKSMPITIGIQALTALAMIVSPLMAVAHEGHNHTPSIEAPHGGVVKKGKSVDLEIVNTNGKIDLYPLNKAGESIPLKETEIKATTQAPRKEKQALAFKNTPEGAFTATVDLENTHRMQLDVDLTYKGKSEKFKHQIEK